MNMQLDDDDIQEITFSNSNETFNDYRDITEN